MPSVSLSPIFNGWQGFTPFGIPLTLGLINTYQAGTNTPALTYTTSSGITPNSNPIALDAGGRPPQEIWLDNSIAYKFILTDAIGNVIGTYDNISGISAASSQFISDLANTADVTKGDALIGVEQPYTGAVAQTQHTKNLQVLSVEDFTGASDTLKLQAAIDGAPNGSRLLCKPGQVYVLTKNTTLLPSVYSHNEQPCLCVYQKQGLVLDGQGATLQINVHAQSVLDVLESSDITIQNFTIIGSGNFPPIDGTTGRAEKGITTAGYYNATTVANGPNRNNSQNTSAFNTGGYGGAFPQFGGGTAATWGTWKGGGYITNAGSGIFIAKGSTDVLVTRCEVSGFNEDGVQIDSGLVESYGWAAPARVTVIENYLHDNYNAGIEVHRCSDLVVHDNTVENNGHPNASIAHTDIDPGYGIGANNGTAPTRLLITSNIFRGNKRKGIDAHSVDTAIITENIVSDSGYGIMLVNGSLGLIRNMIVSDNIVQRIAYPVSAQAAGIYIERNAGAAAGFAGNAVVCGNQVYEVGVPPGQTGIYPGTNPAGIGVQLSGTITGAAVTGNLIQNTTYLGVIGLCIGFAGPDAINGSITGNSIRGGWTNGLNNLASGGTNNSTVANSIELTSVSPYVGAQTGINGATDRFFGDNNINVPVGQSFTSGMMQGIDLIVKVNMSSGGVVTYTTGINQAKFVSSVVSFANGIQINLAAGVGAQAVTFSQTASTKAVRTAGAVTIDYIYIRQESPPVQIGLQASGTDYPATQVTGSITFRISI